RRDVSAVRLRVRRVTRVATVMRRETRRNRQRHSASQGRVVTSYATLLWFSRAGHVLRVIELHVEAFLENRRKIFQRRIVAGYIRVADRAHRHVRGVELREVTVGAVFVARKLWRCGVVASVVTV